ncbi:hypothetical protein [Cupriavidus pauculus]|uniref:hypothetical protein n=1 Tax=Cupriavidus pauculus TaxID=82633 RepID=UPI0015DF5809|nr:hypothetical protein [Cupriavidus pauculus]
MLWIIVVYLAKESKIQDSVRSRGRRPGQRGRAGGKSPEKSMGKRWSESAEFWQQSPLMISLQVTD